MRISALLDPVRFHYIPLSFSSFLSYFQFPSLTLLLHFLIHRFLLRRFSFFTLVFCVNTNIILFTEKNYADFIFLNDRTISLTINHCVRRSSSRTFRYLFSFIFMNHLSSLVPFLSKLFSLTIRDFPPLLRFSRDEIRMILYKVLRLPGDAFLYVRRN